MQENPKLENESRNAMWDPELAPGIEKRALVGKLVKSEVCSLHLFCKSKIVSKLKVMKIKG